MIVVIALFPVLLFLLLLFLLDSFKLVIKKQLLLCVLWGITSAILAYFANSYSLGHFNIEFNKLAQYYSPAIEETLKILFILWLIRNKRIGFMIDAAVYGFAAGAGFALAENLFYLYNINEPSIFIWIIRGFGTSIMHGGCTALFALIIIGAKSRGASFTVNLLFGMATAYIIHSLFNHFLVLPIFQTVGIFIFLPLIFIIIFNYNEKQLQNWLEIEFSSEIELLTMIHKGQFLTTRSGKFVESLKARFSGEVIIDMYCFIGLYLDLSVKAKRNLMLKECGLPIIKEDDVDDKLKELFQLRKQIGKIGELTLSPLIRMNYRDLWKLKTLM
jgi:RsiW-degrading membrane proteinase PrsW (M82 family)